MSNQDIAQKAMELLTQRESSIERGWRWRPGVVLFPEARCPYCKEVVKSKAIWLVTKTQLLGQGVPVRGRELVLEAPYHPHATPSDICFGNAYDPLQALFGGLNPKSAYVAVDKWLKGKYWDHSCEEMEQRSCCSGCEEGLDEDDTYYFSGDTYCNNCFSEVAFYCFDCGDAYSIDESYENPNGYDYCIRCFNRYYFRCNGCSNPFASDDSHSGSDDESYCTDCFVDRFFRCGTCGETCANDDGPHGENDECTECYVPPVRCSECDAEGEALCEDCGVTCSQCSTRFVSSEGYLCNEEPQCDRVYCESCWDGDCLCLELASE